jgi:hypothetical protein
MIEVLNLPEADVPLLHYAEAIAVDIWMLGAVARLSRRALLE